MSNNTERNLQILQTKEIEELYAIPSFEEEDRQLYFNLSAEEYRLMQSFRGLSSRVFFVLQLGYFKAKHQFFVFDLLKQPLDVGFILDKYFVPYTHRHLKPISKPTRLKQRQIICQLLGYRFGEASFLDTLIEQVTLLARRHNHPVYLFRSLLHYFHNKKIVLPAYSFLQRKIISPVLREEYNRLEQVVEQNLSLEEKTLLDTLVEKPEEGMYPFTLLQKEPVSFQYYQIRTQLKYAEEIEPIYSIVLRIYEQMGISNENMRYYGQLAQDYTPFRIRQLKTNMRYVYLLCFVYNRYRFINDILVEALRYHVLGLEKSAIEFAKQRIYDHQIKAHKSLSKIPQILDILRDHRFSDE